MYGIDVLFILENLNTCTLDLHDLDFQEPFPGNTKDPLLETVPNRGRFLRLTRPCGLGVRTCARHWAYKDG